VDADGPNELWLGDSEGRPPHWGARPRRAVVHGRPTLATGQVVYLVSIEPPIARRDGRPLVEAIVMPRYPGADLAAGKSAAIVVNILGPAPGVDIHAPRFSDGQLVVEFWADAATTIAALPEPLDEAAFWAETLERIRRFIEAHGHARVPDGYHDDHGRLDIIVGNLRWHHAGKGGVSPGPFPGVDYASDLDRMPGWEW
jgi:hypothetical protein